MNPLLLIALIAGQRVSPHYDDGASSLPVSGGLLTGACATSTCPRDAATDSSTLFTCGASDAAMCTNVAACLTQATGVAACAGAGCTLFTGVAGTAYLYRA